MRGTLFLLVDLALLCVLLGQEAHATSSMAPATTRMPIFITTAKPTPKPANDLFFVRENDTDYICLLLKLKATFNIRYPIEGNKNSSVAVKFGEDFGSISMDGKCGTYNKTMNESEYESIDLQWRPTDELYPPWKLSFIITQDADSFYVESLDLDYSRSHKLFPGATDVGSRHTISAIHKDDQPGLFVTQLGFYYQCLTGQSLLFTGDSTMQVDSIVINAFRGERSDMYFSGTRHQCDGDAFAGNIVPIIVGCALAFLMLLVLITYLIGRRRVRPGYQSI